MEICPQSHKQGNYSESLMYIFADFTVSDEKIWLNSLHRAVNQHNVHISIQTVSTRDSFHTIICELRIEKITNI